MTESNETAIAVLRVQMDALMRDHLKLETLNTARHAETMAKIDSLTSAVSASREFGRGVKWAFATGWAICGSLVTGAVAWFLWGRP